MFKFNEIHIYLHFHFMQKELIASFLSPGPQPGFVSWIAELQSSLLSKSKTKGNGSNIKMLYSMGKEYGKHI